MTSLLQETLPLATDDFVHHVIKRGFFDLNLKSPNNGRQFVVMQEDESQSDYSEDCQSGGISTLSFLNFVMASISIAASVLSNSNSNSNNNNNNNNNVSTKSIFRPAHTSKCRS